MKVFGFFCFLTTLLLSQSKPFNLLKNGGFEEDLNGWYTVDITKQGKAEILDTAQEGKKSLRLERKGGQGVIMVRQNLRGFSGGRELTLSVSYRSLTGGKATVSIWGYDGKNDDPLLERDVISLTGKKKEWDRKEIQVKVSEKIQWMAIGIRVLEDGEFFFDDVSLSQAGVAVAPGGLLRNGGFELSLLDWEVVSPSNCLVATSEASAKRSGTHGLHLQFTKKCNAGDEGINTQIDRVPSKPIRIKAQARAKQMTVTAEMRFFNEKGALLEVAEIGKGGKDNWFPIEKRLTPPEGAKTAILAFKVQGDGSLDLDDISIETE